MARGVDGDDPDVEAVGGVAAGEDVEGGVVDVDEAVVEGDADAEAVGGAGVDVVGLVTDGEVDGEALGVRDGLGGDERGGGVLVGDVAQLHGEDGAGGDGWVALECDGAGDGVVSLNAEADGEGEGGEEEDGEGDAHGGFCGDGVSTCLLRRGGLGGSVSRE